MGGGAATVPRAWYEAREAVADYHPPYAPGAHAHEAGHLRSLGGGSQPPLIGGVNQPPVRLGEVAPWMEQVRSDPTRGIPTPSPHPYPNPET